MPAHAYAASSTDDPSFRHAFETVDGVRLHYVTAGPEDAQPLVLLAGYPESWFAWRKVMPLLADRFRLIALDLPGQGDSDKPLDGYDTGTVARRIHGVLERIGVSRYGLAAHDIGAWVGLPYALMFPREVERLALLDAGIPGVTLPDMLPAAPDRAWKTWHFAFHAVADLPEALIAGRERVYLDWFLRRKAASPWSFSDSDLDEYVRIFSMPGALRAGLAFYRAVTRSAEQNRALIRDTKLTMPVLAVSADQGSIPDMAGPLRAFADDLRGETVERSGHFIPEEQPEALARMFEDFFARR
ncbi:alpha/beta fold hydrolase [Pseudoxanthomonas winnipegensis]|jgi:pimeloyl-ACP methyl ester carboxylesterase|uniref:Alpha/beta fold hydrolase n=1 Tax=Pseudoxanthomonas winnipegensis TaxID=2480810 RepID=A0ABY1WF69_9GAMM|nr:alpha/beta fold hydrolase [Pseudoxanthomonas winnipegensis]TAA08896.1 alpha/beta fold hydrolase [Pseudoxanthomonas winnipegensis]TAA20595.1 alpha/beta fold hydrolase [Pseudoxanthomonas winnipegensis]TAH71751.1 alpha/beta fold hydrolase [Pseudoxanthomonas winnipegensis]